MTPSSLHAGELRASASHSGELVSLTFAGNADGRADSALETFLHELHAEIAALAVTQVDVDIRTLEFMNSSCFKGFITWIVQVRRMKPPSRYRIRFLATSKYPWQKRSLHAISFFGGSELIEVVTED